MTLRFEIILINSTLYLKLYWTTSDTGTTDLIVLVALEKLAKSELPNVYAYATVGFLLH